MYDANAAAEMSRRVAAAIEVLPLYGDDEVLLPSIRWRLREVMKIVHLDDLSPTEIMAMLAVLTPAHSRKLTASGHPLGFRSRGRFGIVDPSAGPFLRLLAPLIDNDGTGA